MSYLGEGGGGGAGGEAADELAEFGLDGVEFDAGKKSFVAFGFEGDEGKGAVRIGEASGGEHFVIEADLGEIDFGRAAAEFVFDDTPAAGSGISPETIGNAGDAHGGLPAGFEDIPNKGVLGEAEGFAGPLASGGIELNAAGAKSIGEQAGDPLTEGGGSLPQAEELFAHGVQRGLAGGEARAEDLFVDMFGEGVGIRDGFVIEGSLPLGGFVITEKFGGGFVKNLAEEWGGGFAERLGRPLEPQFATDIGDG